MRQASGKPGDTILVRLSRESMSYDLLVLRARVAERLMTKRPRTSGPAVTIDVSGTARLSHEAIATLVWARDGCRQHQVRLNITGPTPGSQRALDRCGLADVTTGTSR